jgi:hypothetical protein
MKFFRKTLIVLCIIFIIYFIFCVVFFIFNGHYWQQNIYNLKWNISNQSKFETKNFIIDLPELHWVGKAKKNGDIYFFGTLKYFNIFDSESNSSMPSLIFHDFNENMIDILQNHVCNVSFNKSIGKINNFEVDIYDCESSKMECSPSKFIIYKNEGFFIYEYNDIFKPQYDKFFEGVRLKE